MALSLKTGYLAHACGECDNAWRMNALEHCRREMQPTGDARSTRSSPRIVMLDDRLNVVFADAFAMAYLVREFGLEPGDKIHRLPPALDQPVRQAIAESTPSQGDRVLPITKNLALRICTLSGPGGSFTVIFLEDDTQRDDIAGAAKRYSLTRRELEVLTLMLQGMSAPEIAESLSIADRTVGDYFKHLIKKTCARNRSEMIAKVFNWDSAQR